MKARDAGIAAAATSAVLIGVGSRLLRARGEGAIAKSFLQLDGRMLLHGMIALVDSRLLSIANTLAVIASSSEAQSGDWESMKPLLSRLTAEYPRSTVGCALPDGTHYIVATDLQPAKVTDRHYFKEAMAGRRVLADLITDRATNEKSVLTAVPVQAGRKTVAIVVVAQFLKPLSRWLEQSLRFTNDINFGVSDTEGTIALDDATELIFQNVRGLSPSLDRVFNEIKSGREGTAAYELNGKEKQVLYATSPLTGWHYVLGLQ